MSIEERREEMKRRWRKKVERAQELQKARERSNRPYVKKGPRFQDPKEIILGSVVKLPIYQWEWIYVRAKENEVAKDKFIRALIDSFMIDISGEELERVSGEGAVGKVPEAVVEKLRQEVANES